MNEPCQSSSSGLCRNEEQKMCNKIIASASALTKSVLRSTTTILHSFPMNWGSIPSWNDPLFYLRLESCHFFSLLLFTRNVEKLPSTCFFTRLYCAKLLLVSYVSSLERAPPAGALRNYNSSGATVPSRTWRFQFDFGVWTQQEKWRSSGTNSDTSSS